MAPTKKRIATRSTDSRSESPRPPLSRPRSKGGAAMAPPRRKTARKAQPPRNPLAADPGSSVRAKPPSRNLLHPAFFAHDDESTHVPPMFFAAPRHSITSPLNSDSMTPFTNRVTPSEQRLRPTSVEVTLHFKMAHTLDPLRQKTAPLRSARMSPLDSVTLKVDPTLVIRHLLYKLRPLLWIPFYEDFRLQQVGGCFIDDPDLTLRHYSVKHQDTLLVFMDGYLFHPTYYLRMLEERGDASVAIATGGGEQLAQGQPHKLNVQFKFINELCPQRRRGFSRDKFSLLLSPKTPIGVLSIMLRARLWIPFYDYIQIKQPSGCLLDHRDSTLESYGVKNRDLLLVSLTDDVSLPDCWCRPLTHSTPTDPTKTMQILVKAAHYLDEFYRHPERSEDQRYVVRLTVSPTLTIGDLKLLLHLFHWAPRKGLVLFAIRGPSTSEDSGIEILQEDTSTLDACGVKHMDTLMTCMEDGAFETRVLDYNKLKSIPLTVNSCFQTVGELKKMIFRVKGYLPENQILVSRLDEKPLHDTTPLVLCGIGKTFMAEMDPQGCYLLELRKPAK